MGLSQTFFEKFLSVNKLSDISAVLIGADRMRKVYARDFIKLSEGKSVLDIGCGDGSILKVLPTCNYIGFDSEPKEIQRAKSKFPNHTFYRVDVGSVNDVTKLKPNSFDLILANGVLHHLDDERAKRLFELSVSILKPMGRLITYDGAYVPNQSKIVRFLYKNDRGRFIRNPEGYLNIAKKYFPDIHSEMRSGLLRIPYDHFFMICQKK